MKIFYFYIFLFSVICSRLYSNELPSYKMIDLGLFGTDSSYATAINDKGQVLGFCCQGKDRYLFLWDESNGLKIIEHPCYNYILDSKLNNNGEIAETCRYENSNKLIYWNSQTGFWEIDSSDEEIKMFAFNNIGQILGNIGKQMILWDHGKKIDLTKLFHEKIPGKWSCFQGVDLNNHGDVAFHAYKEGENHNDQNFGTRSFVWKNGSFSMIMPEAGEDTIVYVYCLDDKGNMILNHGPRNGPNHLYFFDHSKNIFIPCEGCTRIKNGIPVQQHCLPGSLKRDRKGNLYFSLGVRINKLLPEEFPYYHISKAEILDCNSNGSFVGSVDTMYPGAHAFLAVPNNE